MVKAIKSAALAAVVVGSLSGVSASALGNGVAVESGRFTLNIVGFVPVICRAQVEATQVAARPGQVSLGALREFCNSPNGYEVYADHSAGLARASLTVGSQKVPLSASGSTRIRKTNRAGIDSNAISLDIPEGASAGQISFRIVPL